MSLAPWIIREPVFPFGIHHGHHSRTHPIALLDQNFGLGLLNDDLLEPLNSAASLLNGGYLRPWRHVAGRHSGTSNVVCNKDGFKVNLDVQQFRPEEITVKIVDNYVTVEGSHEERSDEHGFISRSFKRRYAIPNEVEQEAVTSTLSSDGVLTITAPPKKPIALADQNERVVPIVRTQAPAVTSAAANGKAAVNGKAKEEEAAKAAK